MSARISKHGTRLLTVCDQNGDPNLMGSVERAVFGLIRVNEVAKGGESTPSLLRSMKEKAGKTAENLEGGWLSFANSG